MFLTNLQQQQVGHPLNQNDKSGTFESLINVDGKIALYIPPFKNIYLPSTPKENTPAPIMQTVAELNNFRHDAQVIFSLVVQIVEVSAEAIHSINNDSMLSNDGIKEKISQVFEVWRAEAEKINGLIEVLNVGINEQYTSLIIRSSNTRDSKDISGALIDSEIRTMFRAEPSARKDILNFAYAAENTQELNAVVNGTAKLSRLTPAQLDRLKQFNVYLNDWTGVYSLSVKIDFIKAVILLFYRAGKSIAERAAPALGKLIELHEYTDIRIHSEIENAVGEINKQLDLKEHQTAVIDNEQRNIVKMLKEEPHTDRDFYTGVLNEMLKKYD